MIPYLPGLKTIRTVKANDAALPTEKKFGINLADYEEIVLNVALQNSATAATVTLYTWSPAAGAFVPFNPGVAVTGGEQQSRFRVSRSDSVFFEVTAITGGSASDERVVLEIGGVPAFDKVG